MENVTDASLAPESSVTQLAVCSDRRNQTWGGEGCNDTNSTSAQFSQKDMDIPEYILVYMSVINPLIFLLGTLGNVSVIVVVIRVKEMRTPTNFCLINLSVADLLVLLICQPSALLEFYAKDRWYLGSVMCKLVAYLENLSTSASILTIVSISLERYVAICHPLLNYSTFSGSKIVKMIALIWIFSALLNAPFLFITYLDSATFYDGTSVYVCRTSFIYIWHHVYLCILFFLVFILPLLLLFVLYFSIIRTLLVQKSLKGAAVSSKNCQAMKSRKQVIYILIGVILIFFFCLLPIKIVIMWIVYGSARDHHKLGLEGYFNLMCVPRILTYLNSAVNPVIYNLISTKFRSAFWTALRMNRCSRRKRKERVTLMSRYSGANHSINDGTDRSRFSMTVV